MKRKAMQYFLEWKTSEDRKPLVLRVPVSWQNRLMKDSAEVFMMRLFNLTLMKIQLSRFSRSIKILIVLELLGLLRGKKSFPKNI
jgi:hypothetical protein